MPIEQRDGMLRRRAAPINGVSQADGTGSDQVLQGVGIESGLRDLVE